MNNDKLDYISSKLEEEMRVVNKRLNVFMAVNGFLILFNVIAFSLEFHDQVTPRNIIFHLVGHMICLIFSMASVGMNIVIFGKVNDDEYFHNIHLNIMNEESILSLEMAQIAKTTAALRLVHVIHGFTCASFFMLVAMLCIR